MDRDLIRLDKFDYESLGISERWYLGRTVNMLSCFEMEINKYYQSDYSVVIFNKLFDKYWDYLKFLLLDGGLLYSTERDPEMEWSYRSDGYDPLMSLREFKTSFSKKLFFECIENDNKANIDVVKLKSYLSGDIKLDWINMPVIPSDKLVYELVYPVKIKLNFVEKQLIQGEVIAKVHINASNIQLTDSVESNNEDKIALGIKDITDFLLRKKVKELSDEKVECAVTTVQITGDRYYFELTGKSWNLQYDDVRLNGVKHSVGMDYIKYLLQRPGSKVGVVDLDVYVGAGDRELDEPAQDEPQDNANLNSDDEMHGIDYSDVANDYTPNCHNTAWDAIDPQSVRENEDRLAQIDAEIKAARSGASFNRSRVKRLEDEQAAIELYLKDANSKPKDPQIEKIRKRILKAVKDTIAKIRRLEEMCNYNDKLLSNHLSRNIKTGSYCSYMAEGDNLPPWKF